MIELTQEQEETLAGFLAEKRAIVIDSASSIRAAVTKKLKNFGVKEIITSNNYSEAVSLLTESYFSIIISEYKLGNRCGLDLINIVKKTHPAHKDLVFVVMTSTSSESVVAEAAEEDVNAFIIKPFTGNSLHAGLQHVLFENMCPTEYKQLIDEGKEQLFSSQLEEAKVTFESAKEKSDKPALACFYLGKTYEQLTQKEEAEHWYSEGLSINSIHYRCLSGLFDFYLGEGRKLDAYKAFQLISMYFPISPKRLGVALHLAVETGHFEDIDHYYDIFTTLDLRSDELIRYVSAGLMVAGMYFIQKKERERAIQLFDRAAIASAKKPSVLRKIIETLVKHAMIKSADRFLGSFHDSERGSVDFQAMDLMVRDARLEAGQIIPEARALIKDGVKDPVVYRILIRRSKEAKFDEAADELIREASDAFPKEKASFEELRAVKAIETPDSETA